MQKRAHLWASGKASSNPLRNSFRVKKTFASRQCAHAGSRTNRRPRVLTGREAHSFGVNIVQVNVEGDSTYGEGGDRDVEQGSGEGRQSLGRPRSPNALVPRCIVARRGDILLAFDEFAVTGRQEVCGAVAAHFLAEDHDDEGVFSGGTPHKPSRERKLKPRTVICTSVTACSTEIVSEASGAC